jgi:signal peptidase I
LSQKEGHKKSVQREILEIAGAFIIAWLVYQLLSMATGTALPIVSVVSDSMYHTSHFDNWWSGSQTLYAAYNISEARFKTFLAPNGLSRGDLLVVIKPDNPKIGDIMIYNKFGSDFTIVHRLVAIREDAYIVKGDNNRAADPPVAKEYVVGKVILAVPLLGYPRLLLHQIGI